MSTRPPITGVLRLTRVTTAFGAVANLWFVILWTRAHPEEPGTAELNGQPLWLLLLAATAAGIGLYAFGAALNDVVDRSRDRALRRDRPIPAGQASPDTAALSVAAFLIVALLGASPMGPSTVLVTLLVALGIVVFNLAGKWVPAFGMVLLGLIYAGQMLAANPELRFIWPVVLVMTHALATAAVTHVLGDRSPRLSARAVALAATGWAVATGLLVALGAIRGAAAADVGPVGASDGVSEGVSAAVTAAELSVWPAWVALPTIAGPAALAVAYAIVVARRVRRLGRTPRAAEKVARYGALWPALYGAAWLLGDGRAAEGGAMLGLAVVGLLAMTILRELYGLIDQPISYRR